MDIKNLFPEGFFKSKVWRSLFIIFITIVVVLLSFSTGVMVGARKANFSMRWSDNYHDNFGGPRGGMFNEMDNRDFLESAGAFGPIVKITDNNLMMLGRNNVEKNIAISASTVIKKMNTDLKLSDLRVDDFIVVIGDPNVTGQITAKLIRVMPPQPPLPPQPPQR